MDLPRRSFAVTAETEITVFHQRDGYTDSAQQPCDLLAFHAPLLTIKVQLYCSLRLYS